MLEEEMESLFFSSKFAVVGSKVFQWRGLWFTLFQVCFFLNQTDKKDVEEGEMKDDMILKNMGFSMSLHTGPPPTKLNKWGRVKLLSELQN